MASSSPQGNDFEVVDSTTISFVRRGRKAIVDKALVAKLSGLPVGKALSINKLALSPNSETYAKDKSRISSQIRNACREAGMAKGTFEIRWSVDGIPAVIR